MPNRQMRVNHTIRKARRNYECARWNCHRGIWKGQEYMQVREYKQTYHLCLDCWNNKTTFEVVK